MKIPLLSIVSISYNQSHYLRQCIESVLSQKDEEIEYTVVDPGSTDGSREIALSYGSAIDRCIFEKDAGPADGLNAGFRQSRGEFGYFINSDDYVMPNTIGYIKRLLHDQPNIDLILGGAWMINKDGQPIRELRSVTLDLESLLEGDSPVVQQGIVFRRSLYMTAGEFNSENHTCWDYELLCAMLKHMPKVYRSNKRFAAFRMHENSFSGGVNGEAHLHRYNEDLDRIYRTYKPNKTRGRGPIKSIYRKTSRLVRHPTYTLTQLWDRLHRGAIHQRWMSDLSS